eukprot:227003_1
MSIYQAFVVFGGGFGYSAGLATKTYGKYVLGYCVVGLGAFAYLSFKGYIDFDAVKGNMESALDQDGDGDFDEEDRKILAEKYSKHWKRILCIASGFMVGFTVAIKIKAINIEYE